MPSEAITAATHPPFPTYLLPSFSFPSPSTFRPFRRRQSSTSSITSSVFSSPSLDTSPISPGWSPNTTPSSSPLDAAYFNLRPRSAALFASTVQEDEEEEQDDCLGTRLARTHPDTLKCSNCATDIAFTSQIVSKGFTGRHGRAYLVSPPPATHKHKPGQTQKAKAKGGNLVNTKVARPVNRQLVTGAHVVADISCVVCNSVVGWKYVDAKEVAQRYKIGKFILETRRIVGTRTWEDVEGPNGNWEAAREVKDDAEDEDAIVFDSEDEDECEDLFAGVWDADSVRKRRGRRVGIRSGTDA